MKIVAISGGGYDGGMYGGILDIFGLETDVPETGTEIDPTQPGAKMTAFCVNCDDEGIKLPALVDPGERMCPYMIQGTWKWLGRLWVRVDCAGTRRHGLLWSTAEVSGSDAR